VSGGQNHQRSRFAVSGGQKHQHCRTFAAFAIKRVDKGLVAVRYCIWRQLNFAALFLAIKTKFKVIYIFSHIHITILVINRTAVKKIEKI
jgi:hypothetical protein